MSTNSQNTQNRTNTANTNSSINAKSQQSPFNKQRNEQRTISGGIGTRNTTTKPNQSNQTGTKTTTSKRPTQNQWKVSFSEKNGHSQNRDA